MRRSVIVVSQILSLPKEDLGRYIGTLDAHRVDQALEGLRFQQRSFFDER
jgi:mRNA interferase MazF